MTTLVFTGCAKKPLQEKAIKEEYFDGEVMMTKNGAALPAGKLGMRLLGLGAQGEDVRTLQERLKLAGFVNLQFSPGVFDEITKKAVINYQKGENPYLKEILHWQPADALEPTGVVGLEFCRQIIRKTGFHAKLILYEIKLNDNLWTLAQKFKVPFRAIILLNNFNSANPVLKVSQKIFFIIHPDPNHEKIYSIQAGDSLEKIAEKNQISVPEIIEANCLFEGNALKAGEKIYLPAPAENPEF